MWRFHKSVKKMKENFKIYFLSLWQHLLLFLLTPTYSTLTTYIQSWDLLEVLVCQFTWIFVKSLLLHEMVEFITQVLEIHDEIDFEASPPRNIRAALWSSWKIQKRNRWETTTARLIESLKMNQIIEGNWFLSVKILLGTVGGRVSAFNQS